MKTSFFTFLLIITSNLLAQNSWVNFATDYLIWDIEVEGNLAWVATQGGLIKINHETGAKETFQSYNSPLQGTGIETIDIASDGTKWFGTKNGGLIKYDGSSWEQFYYLNTGDTIEGVVELKIAPNDDVWFIPFCTGCSKLLSYENGTFKDHSDILTLIPNSNFVDYDFISSNELWVAISKTIYRYDGENVIESFDSSNSVLLADEIVMKVVVDEQGILWVFTQVYNTLEDDFRLLKFDGNDWTVENETVPGRCFNAFKDSEGDLWAEFWDESLNFAVSYAKYDGNNWTFFTINDLPNIPYIYSEPELHHVDDEGNMWMSAHINQYEPRIFKVDENSFTEFNTEIFPIGHNYFSDVQIDCDSNYWFMGGGVLSKFDGVNWEMYSSSETGMSGDIRTMGLDTNTCEIWFAVYSNGNGNLVKYNGSSFQSVTDDEHTFTDVIVRGDGAVWGADPFNGIGKYENSVWTWYNEYNSPISAGVFDIAFDSNGILWAASFYDGLIRFDGNDWQVFDSSNSPIEDYSIAWLFIDNDDHIWLTHDIGLLRFDGTNWELFDIETGSSTVGVSSMEQDDLGSFWLGTYYVGAIYWNGFDFVYYDVTNSDIGSNFVKNIFIDDCGDIWFVHNVGISLLKQGDICGENNTNLGAHGLVYYDANQDGVFDFDEDVRLPDQKVWLYPDSIMTFTNTIGAYSFYPEPGAYEVSFIADAPWINTSANFLDFSLLDEPIIDLNFGSWTSDIPEGVSVDITIGHPICNLEFNVWVTFRNEGFADINGEIELNFDPAFGYVDSYPEVSNVETGQVTWNIEGLGFMETRTYQIGLLAPGVDYLNIPLDFTTIINPGNYIEDDTTEVVCGYDPNDKIAQPLGDHYSNYSLMGDSIEYTIRFQNEGNYTAFDITIIDTLDPFLDISTLKVISSSHNIQTTIEASRTLKFQFEDINLPPAELDYLGSQGFVKYQISPLPELENNTIIKNSAGIYFDFNPPITTNTTENIIVDSLVISNTENFTFQEDVSIYPNPTSSDFWIVWNNANQINEIWQIRIYDQSGKIIQQKSTNLSKFNITLPGQGFYLIQIEKEDILLTKKVVVVQ
jgi:uncharacterized repeat protein (TIGR01451 family)